MEFFFTKNLQTPFYLIEMKRKDWPSPFCWIEMNRRDWLSPFTFIWNLMITANGGIFLNKNLTISFLFDWNEMWRLTISFLFEWNEKVRLTVSSWFDWNAKERISVSTDSLSSFFSMERIIVSVIGRMKFLRSKLWPSLSLPFIIDLIKNIK